MDLKRILRRAWFLVSYHLHAKHKISRTDRIELFGLDLIVPPSVFHPALYFSTKYFGKFLSKVDFRGKMVLDIGCGSGILGLIAASHGASVVAVDVNPDAVRATVENTLNNNLEDRLRVIQSDLFDRLDKSERSFDYFLVNPPYYSGEPATMSDRAWKSGIHLDFFRRLCMNGKKFLKPSGQLLFILSSDSDIQSILEIFSQHDLGFKSLADKRYPFERLEILSASYNKP